MTHEEQRVWLIKQLQKEKSELSVYEIPEDEQKQKNLLRALMNIWMPEKLDEEFLKIQDEYLKEESERAGIVDLADLEPLPCDDRLYLWKGDMTTLRVDAITNPANSALLGCFRILHNCADNCIHSKAGLELRYHCNKIMRAQGHEEPTGRAKITPGYNLPCKYVLHTVGPIVQEKLQRKHEELLASCYRSCLELAEEYEVKSIAFCCISTGVFMFPNERAAEIAVDTVRKYLEETGSRMKVVFNVFKEEDYEIYSRILMKKITFESFLNGTPATDYIHQNTPYQQQIREAAAMLREAEYVLVGAGAGLSTAAGAEYGGTFFEKNFREFQEKYGKGPYMQDMYSAGFYPYPDEESYWGYWSKQALLGGVNLDVTPLYKQLLAMLGNKNVFVLSTNVDGQFEKAGLSREHIFCTQGDYFHIQCQRGCHAKTYHAVKLFQQMDQARRDCKVPRYMVPKCPVCGGPMDMNLRKDQYFVQDEEWFAAEARFSDFLTRAVSGKLVLLELGVGFNTPTIIRFPFEKLVREHRNIKLIRLNLDQAVVPESFGAKTVGINADMAESIRDMAKELMTIEKAKENELPEILRIYEIARSYMRQTGNPNQWKNNFPPEECLKADIQAGNLYVVKECGIIHAVFAFIIGEDPTYAVIEQGAWRSDALYGTLHRVASDGQLHGVFDKMVEFCYERVNHLRIDTHEDNKVMQHLILKNGFTKCGIIYIADGSPRIAYEKV